MSDEVRFSAKRNRTYTRKFNHDEARRRHAAGESTSSIAQDLGVSRYAIYYVIKHPDVSFASPVYTTSLYRCPVCHGSKTREAEMCRECRKDVRLPKTKLRHRAGIEDVELSSVEFGRVVRYRDEYAVVEPDHWQTHRRWLHYWDSPPECVSERERVDLMSYSEVVE